MVVQMEPIRVKSLFRSLLVFALAAHRKKMNQEALRALLYNSFENRRMGDVVINVRMPWVYSARNKRWHQNVVRTAVTNSTAPCCYPFLFYKHFDVICEFLRNRHVGTFICQVDGEQSIVCLASSHSGIWGKKGEGWIDGKGLFFSSSPHLLHS